jgi:hypothetical protein
MRTLYRLLSIEEANLYRTGVVLAILSVELLFSSLANARTNQSDAQIKQEIIKRSIASYPGNCACPYNAARNGSNCGRRSAYSRAGGYSVICYPDDVTDDMVRNYKQQQ